MTNILMAFEAGWDVIPTLRFLNIALGILGGTWLLIKTSSQWSSYHLEGKLYAITLMIFVYGATYGTGQAIVNHDPPGLRVFLLIFANLNLMVALMATRGRGSVGQQKPLSTHEHS